MIRYNFNRIFKARGIDRPFTFLKNSGFSPRFATTLIQHRIRQLNLDKIERLCLLFRCTPNDFLEWTPNKGQQVDQNHPINEIRKSDVLLEITKTLNEVPLISCRKLNISHNR